MKAELKPCPFCGSKPEGTTSGKDNYAGCRTEGCPVGGWDMDLEKWQSRPTIHREEWVSVKDRLPEKSAKDSKWSVRVIVYDVSADLYGMENKGAYKIESRWL